MELARRHLRPPKRGIEIGASANNPFPGVDAWNLDYPGGGIFRAAQQQIAGRACRIDVYGLGDDLPFADRSLEFVLSSHVLEHMPDTIRCLGEWDRVLAVDGIVFMIVPHRARTFDSHRPRTEFEHHLADLALGMTIERSPMVPTSHYHVWETADVLRIVERLNALGWFDWEVLDVEDVDSKVGNGFTVVARKRRCVERVPSATAARGRDGRIAFHLLTLELPFRAAMRTIEFVVRGEQLVLPGDLPRGTYRAVPIRDGFPPVALAPFSLEVGDAVPPPRIDAVARTGSELWFTGAELGETTYLQADFGDGRPRHILPRFVDGRLAVDIAGLPLPAHGFAVQAVNVPPGGGASRPWWLEQHLGP